MEFKKIKIEEFEKLKKLFPDNEEMWIKYKKKRLQQLEEQEIDVVVIEDNKDIIGELTVNYKSHQLETETIPNKRVYLKNINNINTKSYIGKTITAKIDRKMGSKHPKFGFVYPINYGYVPNTISGDGEELDCYILGVFEPIEGFAGECIAIIHRLNDNDDKLVLVPKDKKYTNDEIRVLTEFQERFFESIIIN